MEKNQRWVYARVSKGTKDEPKVTDFKLLEEDIPRVKDGEVLFEALYLSVDPHMKVYLELLGDSTGFTMFGTQVARVVESKHPDYEVGSNVLGQFGWQLYTVCKPEEVTAVDGSKEKPVILPDFGSLPASLALGVLGMPGNTAYLGFLEICNPKAGDVVVVSGAAGAVGSLVGQIAKIKGCHVIGIAGSDAKTSWLKNELHFDSVINYKTQDVPSELKKLAPKGVDCYFDNVGGEISSQVLYQMNRLGRVAVIGAVSYYNSVGTPEKVTAVQPAVLRQELKMQGFVIWNYSSRWMEAVTQNMNWIKEGKLKYRETITEGFSKMPAAYIGMLQGDHTGKAIVKA